MNWDMQHRRLPWMGRAAFLLGMILMASPAGAAATQSDLLVAARALGFMENGPKGEVTVGTVYDPGFLGAAVPKRIGGYTTLNARVGYNPMDNVTLAVTSEGLGQPRRIETAGTPIERRVFVTLSVRR